jgi:hypothetical protein
MTEYIIKEGVFDTKVVTVTKDTVVIPWDNKRGAATITDTGNYWQYTDGLDANITLNYLELADIVLAFILFQKEGVNLYDCEIFERTGRIKRSLRAQEGKLRKEIKRKLERRR